MTPTDEPTTQSVRLEALRESGMLDAPRTPSLDTLTKLAAAALRVPVTLISLVDADRQFFASDCGLPEPWASRRETPLSHSFCQHVAASGEPLLIEDARTHPLVRDNLAIPDLGVLAYAGVPIVDVAGHVLGSLCAIDTVPRTWGEQDVTLLRALSAQITADLHLRAESSRLAEELDRQRISEADRLALTRLNVHDLRTPLSAMILGLEVLPRLGPLNEKQAGYLSLAKRNGQALVALVNNLLDIGNMDHRGVGALSLRECQPELAIASAVDQVRDIARERSIAVTVELEADLPAISADFDMMIRVLVNLLANAVKFTGDGGRVTVRATVDRQAAARLIHVAVADTGIGMADTTHIFDEGVRLDPNATSRRSTGLGLTFCKRTVEAHHGKIWVETKLGEGSTFHFTVPAAATRN